VGNLSGYSIKIFGKKYNLKKIRKFFSLKYSKLFFENGHGYEKPKKIFLCAKTENAFLRIMVSKTHFLTTRGPENIPIISSPKIFSRNKADLQSHIIKAVN
jgi:hypothetical protein